MNKRLTNLSHFKDIPVVGIVRNMSASDFEDVLPVYYEAGLRIVEVTMNTSGATDMIRYANKQFDDKLIVGAGTVCTQTALDDSLKAGARFIVTPILNEDIISSCVKKNVPIIPGAYTPTEIYRAWSAGAALVKLFPATLLGAQYIKDVKGPLNDIAIMPTGGIDHKNIVSFFRAGAVAAGVGSKLFDQAMIKEKNWNGLVNHFVAFVDAVKSVENRSI